MEFLLNETAEKAKNDYAKVVIYGDIRHNLPKNIKISPVSMIPHKVRCSAAFSICHFNLKIHELEKVGIGKFSYHETGKAAIDGATGTSGEAHSGNNG